MLVVLFWSGAPAVASTGVPLLPKPDPGDLRYADLVKAAATFDEVIVWEGLPHPLFEHEVHEKARAGQKTFRIGDQDFYAASLPFKDEEKTALSDAVLKHIENFNPWSGLKFCGGFHADYAIEWRYEGVTVAQALFCFSCGEAQFRVGERVEQVDQSEGGVKRFHALLSSHHQLRPASQTTEASKPVATIERPAAPKVDNAAPPIAPPAIPAPSPPKIEIPSPSSK